MMFDQALTAGWTWAVVILQFTLPLYALLLGVFAALIWLYGLEASYRWMATFRNVSSVLVWTGSFLWGLWLVLQRFRIELRLRRTFRQDFADRRMSNDSLADLIKQLGAEGIVESLMTRASIEGGMT
jgi:hypothetical protein